jgi:hypothetical protein
MEVGGRTWASYWLFICGSFLVVGSVVLTWLKFPYSFNVRGWELPVQNIVPHIHKAFAKVKGDGQDCNAAQAIRKFIRWSLGRDPADALGARARSDYFSSGRSASPAERGNSGRPRYQGVHPEFCAAK